MCSTGAWDSALRKSKPTSSQTELKAHQSSANTSVSLNICMLPDDGVRRKDKELTAVGNKQWVFASVVPGFTWVMMETNMLSKQQDAARTTEQTTTRLLPASFYEASGQRHGIMDRTGRLPNASLRGQRTMHVIHGLSRTGRYHRTRPRMPARSPACPAVYVAMPGPWSTYSES